MNRILFHPSSFCLINEKRPPTGERWGYAKVYFSTLKQSCPVGDAGCAMMMMVLEFAQGVVTNDTLTKMIDAMAGSEDPGVVSFTARGIKNGQEIQIAISEGVLKGLAAALLSGQQAGF